MQHYTIDFKMQPEKFDLHYNILCSSLTVISSNPVILLSFCTDHKLTYKKHVALFYFKNAYTNVYLKESELKVSIFD